MIYHAVPMPHPSNVLTHIDGFARREMRELNAEMLKSVTKLSNKSSVHSPELIYLFNTDVDNKLAGIRPGDTLIIHAEGNPFIISPGFSDTPYCLTAGELAEHLVNNKLPNTEMSIKILACNSGTQVEGKTFAQDLSQVLYYLHNLKKIIVEGYNGFIIVKKNSKYSASSISNNSSSTNYTSRVPKTISKGTHASLDEVSCCYKKGCLLIEPQKPLIANTNNPYCYLDSGNKADLLYLEKTYEYRNYVSIKKSLKKLLKAPAEEPELCNIAELAIKPCPSPRFSPNALLLSPRSRSTSRNGPIPESFSRY